MNKKYLLTIVLPVILILNACSPFAFVRSSTSYQDRAPVVEPGSPTGGYQPVVVDDVQVSTGSGSTAPVQVRVSGVLPDQCSQIEYSEIKQDGSNFVVSLSTIAGGSECMKDAVPFIISIPINVAGLPAGSYSATVNGVRGDFTLRTGTQPRELRAADQSFIKRDIPVDRVTLQIGVGSPIPVHAVVSGLLPNSCAWLGEIRLHRDRNTYFVQLLAYVPSETNCDPAPLRFLVEIPLNAVNLPDGSYSVNVNGATGGFQVPLNPSSATAGEGGSLAGWVTYTSERYGYSISYPSEMEVTDQSQYSQTLKFKVADPDAGATNFIYVSVITPEILGMVKQGVYDHDVYNYDPAATEILLNMQINESESAHPDEELAAWFTYQRLADTTISGHVSQTYENTRPWDFPKGTKEIRYYLSRNGSIYMIGGYVDTAGSNRPGAITEDLLHQIVATVQLTP